jgi:hypothetical protein
MMPVDFCPNQIVVVALMADTRYATDITFCVKRNNFRCRVYEKRRAALQKSTIFCAPAVAIALAHGAPLHEMSLRYHTCDSRPNPASPLQTSGLAEPVTAQNRFRYYKM